jgi:hypothetical protein
MIAGRFGVTRAEALCDRSASALGTGQTLGADGALAADAAEFTGRQHRHIR